MKFSHAFPLLALATTIPAQAGPPAGYPAHFEKVALSRGERAPIDRSRLSGMVLPASSHFKVDPAYVSRHDIVYLSPNVGAFEGFPMGNGDLGGMIWTTDEGIQVQVNKSNTYDKEGGFFHLKSLGRLNIRFGAPCFEWLQLNDFEGRLSLHDATARYRAETPFMKTAVEAITCADRNVWMISCEADLVESFLDSLTVSVDFDRYGSRRLAGFKGPMRTAKPESIGKAKAAVAGKDLVITETFTDMNFAVAVRVLGSDASARLLNDRRGSLEFPMASKQKVTILLSAVTSDEAADPAAAAVKLLDETPADQLDPVREGHAQWWNDFWNRSFVHLDDDYLENIYHTRRYLMAAGSRAHYPVIYNAGIWQWNRDARNWFTLMGWNQLNTYVGLDPQNDCDLMLPYLDLYWRLEPFMEAKAEERFQLKDCLLIGEPHDVRGHSVSGEGPGGHSFNFTGAPIISRFFLKQYEFTQDLDFLRDYAYPFARKTGQTYLDYLKWDDETGRYTIHPAKPYECGYKVLFHDTITDLAMIRHLFPRLIEYSKVLELDADQREKWQHVLDHLWDPPLTERDGLGTIFAETYQPDGKTWPEGNDDTPRRFHFSAGSALGFPGEVLDLDDRGTEEFDIMNRFLEMHFDFKSMISHDPIVAARMGNSDRLMRFFEKAIQNLQHYPQGLLYNMDTPNNDNNWYLHEYDPKNPTPHRVADYIYDLRAINTNGNRRVGGAQMAMEAHSIHAAAVNEMLLQSHDGKIRVFPATPKEWRSAFILRAAGGFMVSAEKEKGKEPDHVMISSAFGKDLRLVNPWETDKLAVTDGAGKAVKHTMENGLITFATASGQSYLIAPKGSTPAENVFASKPSQGPKRRGSAMIGKDRDFNRVQKIEFKRNKPPKNND